MKDFDDRLQQILQKSMCILMECDKKFIIDEKEDNETSDVR